jgi:hypothetical protein
MLCGVARDVFFALEKEKNIPPPTKKAQKRSVKFLAHSSAHTNFTNFFARENWKLETVFFGSFATTRKANLVYFYRIQFHSQGSFSIFRLFPKISL